MKNWIAFIFLCLAWGSTWPAIKIGVTEMPPLGFAGSRFFCAGIIILLFQLSRKKEIRINSADIPCLFIVSFLMVSITSGLIFWGEIYVSASFTAIVVQCLIPVALPFFSMLYGKEALTYARLLSIAIGIIGFFMIFVPTIQTPESLKELYGLSALVFGTLAYCWGSVLSKDILSKNSAVTISGYENLIGGILLMIVALFFENGNVINPFSYITKEAILSWLFLVIVGSLIGFTLYLHLLKEWGASNVSIYAFITPLVAILIDALFMNNVISIIEAFGVGTIFIAVFLSLRPPNALNKAF